MFIGIQEFVRVQLPLLLAGKLKLKVLFATYNSVLNTPDGPVVTGDQSLQIEVKSGKLEYSPLTYFMMSLGTPLLVQSMEREAATAQEILEKKVDITSQADEPSLVVVYLGLSAFDRALTFARRIQRDNPNTIIVTLTCDCDREGKDETLAPLVEQGVIRHSIVDRYCGGDGAMQYLLHAMLQAWPLRSPHEPVSPAGA